MTSHDPSRDLVLPTGRCTPARRVYNDTSPIADTRSTEVGLTGVLYCYSTRLIVSWNAQFYVSDAAGLFYDQYFGSYRSMLSL